MLEYLRYPPSDGGILGHYHVLVEPESLEKVDDIEVARALVLIVREPDYIRDYLVVFVVYLADELLDDVLKRYHSLGAAVLVGHDSKVYLRALHRAHCLAYELGIGDMRHFLNNAADIVLALDEHFEERFVGYDTDDIVEALLIDGQTRIHLAGESLLYLVDCVGDVDAYHLHARDKYLLDGYLVKFESTFYELALLLFNDAFFLYPQSDKEFTVVFSSAELERMAYDEKYAREKLSTVKTAVEMSDKINEQFGFERAWGTTDNSGTVLNKLTMSFDDDGKMTLFADLEKITEKQKERLEELKEKRTEEKKQEKKDVTVKRTTIQANSKEELLEKISELDWSKITEEKATQGMKFDITI